MPESCHVLLVEDDEDDFLITRDLLAGQNRMRFELDWSSDYEAGLAEIRRRTHDVYLIDYRLGRHTGLDLVREGFGSGPPAPVLLLTGQDDYEIDLEATALGVTDYLVKQGLDAAGLERAIRYAISHSRALTDLARSRERYALATRASNDGVWDWDLQTGRIHLSHRWYAILGLEEPVDDAEPDRWFELVHPDDLPELRAAIDSHLAGRTQHLEFECRMRYADGSWLWVLCRGLAIRGADNTPTRIAGSIADITQRRVAEERLRYDALHDALTGLPNRALLADRIEQIVRRSIRDPLAGCAVMLLDLDRFKLVNDSFSHATGDQLLVAIAARLNDCLEPGDTIARLGGDEFTLVLDGITSSAQANARAQELCDAFEQPFEIAGRRLFTRASIGICLSRADLSAGELLRNADIAMYDSKQRGGNTHALFDQTMHQRVVSRMTHESELRKAVERSLIGVHYQPIVDLASGRVTSLEALARWPEGWPSLPPSEFISIAEESGLIVALGQHVLRTALEALIAWQQLELAPPDLCINVNVSRVQLDDPALPDQILGALTDAGIAPERLRLEITESTLMHEPERISRIVADVCDQGVGLELDDFGTGYSSLAALLDFPFRALKIDRGFVNPNSEEDDVNQAIVRSTIALAQSLSLKVTGEGVETPAQLDALRALGCDCAQGYLLSPPVSELDVVALLDETWLQTRANEPR
jgi:diguanylate cyclase (GGDEF)-like protein/PAS domain S-box-containing protein